MVGLRRRAIRQFRDREPIDNLGLDKLKNDIKRLSEEWCEWKSIPNERVRILNVLNGYEGNDKIRTNCSEYYALPSIILSACKERLNETDIKETVNKIIQVLCGERYTELKAVFQESLNQEEKALIKSINDFSPFKEHKIAKAVELCVSKDILSDEPLGCYVRPGILKLKQNVHEFVDHPKIVFYKEKIEEFAKSKEINQKYITAFVYLYQLCRMYFDRYPYGNLLEYVEWDLNDVVKINDRKIQGSIVRKDIVSSVERPIVALAALHYADQINKDVLKAGVSIISDEEIYVKWKILYKWNLIGKDLYNKGNKELIDTYRDVAVLISSDDNNDNKDNLISLINAKSSLLNDIKQKIDFKSD